MTDPMNNNKDHEGEGLVTDAKKLSRQLYESCTHDDGDGPCGDCLTCEAAAALQAQPASNGVVTDAMIEAGVNAINRYWRHDAKAAARACFAEMNAVLAMRQAQPAADVEGLVAKAARAFEAEALAVASERDGDNVFLQPGLDEMEPEMRIAFYRCLRAALSSDIIGGSDARAKPPG